MKKIDENGERLRDREIEEWKEQETEREKERELGENKVKERKIEIESGRRGQPVALADEVKKCICQTQIFFYKSFKSHFEARYVILAKRKCNFNLEF